MREDIAKAWIKDLENNPPQAKGRLFDGRGYCCLGRLALILGAEFEQDINGTWGIKGTEEKTVLTQELLDKAEMKYHTGDLKSNGNTIFVLAELNDQGTPFSAIARLIRRNWRNL